MAATTAAAPAPSRLRVFNHDPAICLGSIADHVATGWTVVSVQRIEGGAYSVEFTRPRKPRPSEGSDA